MRECLVCGTTDTWAMRKNPQVCNKCNPEQLDGKRFFSDYDTIKGQEIIARYWRVPDKSFLEEAK